MSLPGRELPPSFSESFFAANADAEKFGNSDAYARNRWEFVQGQIERYHDITGESLPNPENIMGPEYAADRERQYQYVRDRFDAYRQQNPETDLGFPDEQAIHNGAMESGLLARRANQELDAQRVAAGGSSAAWWGSMLGGAWGGLKDPINLAAMALGAPAGATILRTALIEAGLNAGSQAAIEAGTYGIKKEMDPTWSASEAAQAVGGAAIGGAVIGGGAAALAAGARKLFGRGSVPPAVQDSLNVVERQQEIAASSPLPQTVAGDVAHLSALQKAAQDIEAGRPIDVSEQVAPAFEPPTVENGGLTPLDPRTVGVDAETFQYKAGGDDAGVTDRLRGITEWRPERAGVSIVYERADGTRVVADGHQRRGLAMRILEQGDGQEPRLNSVIYREADGWTPEQVRALAAAKNIAEGTGSPLDAAKVLRDGDAGIVRSLPPTSALVRDAKGLAQLDREPFGMVVNGVVPEQYGAIVGRLVAEGPMQRDVMGLLAKLQPANRTEAEAIVRQAMEAGAAERTASSQGSLFGDEVVQESLFLERARVLDRALKVLRKDRTVFGTLTAEADRITGAGNVLDSAANLARADADGAAIQTLTTLANRKGALSDALTAAARRAREEGQYGAAVRDFVDAARREGAPRPANDGGPTSLAAAARPVDEVSGTPEAQDSLFQQVDRLMASRDLDVPMEVKTDPDTGRQVSVKRTAMDLMDEANRAIDDAATVAACAFGVAAE